MDDWHAIDIYDGDPTPGTPASIQAMATSSQRRAQEINGHAAGLRSVAANSGAMRLRGDYAAKIDRELGRLPGEAKVLADAYVDCAAALSAFAKELTRLQARSRSALRIGMTAESQYRGLLQRFCGLTGMRTYGPGVWHGLDESYAAPLREPVRSQALAIARNARLCAEERRKARASALQAKYEYEVAAALCVRAVQAAGMRLGAPGSGRTEPAPTRSRAPRSATRRGSAGKPRVGARVQGAVEKPAVTPSAKKPPAKPVVRNNDLSEVTITVQREPFHARAQFDRKMNALKKLSDEGKLFKQANPVARDKKITDDYKARIRQMIFDKYWPHDKEMANRLSARLSLQHPDHVWELQLGGADDVSNLKLLHGLTNVDIGKQIWQKIMKLPDGTPIRIEVVD
ncbi:hypothetical protein [Micromonospora sp. 050-3]|uniref:hypothetical protein n=1 Tax=Micromonospora sp. 050-3 TaxID=2789265 RepID=UPI00397C7623